jgi:hypothetical protein
MKLSLEAKQRINRIMLLHSDLIGPRPTRRVVLEVRVGILVKFAWIVPEASTRRSLRVSDVIVSQLLKSKVE